MNKICFFFHIQSNKNNFAELVRNRRIYLLTEVYKLIRKNKKYLLFI